MNINGREAAFETIFEVPLRNGLNRPKRIRGEGIKMVNMGELFAYDRIFNPPMDLVPVSPKDISDSLLRTGDLLFARQSLVLEGAGKCSIFLGADEPVTWEGHIIRVRLNPKLADPLFFYYYFSSSVGKGKISTIVEQVAAAGIRGSDLAKLKVPVPPLPDQRRIAAILSAFDDKIELNHRMNATLEEIARNLFESWFVDFDPVRAKQEGRPTGLPTDIDALFPNGFEDSELGEIPRGWRVGRLIEEFNLTMGVSPPGSTYNQEGEGPPFYQGRVDFGFRYPSPRIFCNAPKRFASTGDTLVSVRAPVGDINLALEECCIGRGVAAIRHKSGSRSFTYYSMRQLKTIFGKFEAEGTVFGSINKGDFESIKFISPPMETTAAFEKWCNPIDDRIKNGTIEMTAVKHFRDAMLPRLMMGDVSLGEHNG